MKRKRAIITMLVVTFLMAFITGCNSNSSSAPEPSPNPDTSPPTTEALLPQGEIKTYTYQNFEFELTGVKSERTETMLDDGGSEWQYTVITYYPGAVLTVIKADMSDATYNADGKAHPQWGILVATNPEERIRLADDMQPLEITPDMAGIYNLEASLYIFRFELFTE